MWFWHQEIPDPENGMWVIQSYVCMPMNLLVTPTETKIKVSKISTLLCWELHHLFHFSFDVIAYKFIFHSLKWTASCEDSVLLSISIWSFPFGLKTMKIHIENQTSPTPPTSHAPRPKKKTSALRPTANCKELTENQGLWVVWMLVTVWIYQVITEYAMTHMLNFSKDQMGSYPNSESHWGHSKSP